MVMVKIFAKLLQFLFLRHCFRVKESGDHKNTGTAKRHRIRNSSPLYFQRLVDLNHCNSSQAFQNINTRPTSFFHFLVTPNNCCSGQHGQQKDQPSDFRKSALLLLYIHSTRFPHAAAAFSDSCYMRDSELPVT